MSISILNNIVKTYHALSDTTELTSSHWKNRNKNKVFNEEELESFRKPYGLSYGLDDRWDGKTSELLLDTLKIVPYDFLFKCCPKENVGNSIDAIKLKDCYLSGNDLIHIDWAYSLFNKIKVDATNKGRLSVLEIGGGYGSLCRILECNMDVHLYSIVELPLSASLSAYYLSLSVDASVNLNGEKIKVSGSGKVINIYTVGNNEWIDNKYDVVINTRSMMEMNKDVIAYYFDIIQRVCKVDGYFLNINRYHKNSVGEDVEISEFPYDEKWTVIESKKSFKQEHIHYLLTQRKNQASDIFSELLEIRKSKECYKKLTSIMLWSESFPSVSQKNLNFLYDFLQKMNNIFR